MPPRKKKIIIEDTIDTVDTAEVSNNIGVVYNCGKLNVRKEPSKSSEVLAIIDAGTAIELLGEKVNGFYPIKYINIVGYCMSEYINAEKA